MTRGSTGVTSAAMRTNGATMPPTRAMVPPRPIPVCLCQGEGAVGGWTDGEVVGWMEGLRVGVVDDGWMEWLDGWMDGVVE